MHPETIISHHFDSNSFRVHSIAFTYRVTPQVMLAGLLFALVLGALGGVLPAFGAARKAILVALREG